jgi:hypothetical protein
MPVSSINATELRFGTDRHSKIVDAIQARVNYWEEKYTDKLDRLAKDDDIFTAYIKETDADAARRANREDGEPEYTTLVVPYSYSALLSAHTYWTSVFLSRTPIHQFTGRHGEAEHQTQAIEALIDYQVGVGNLLSKYYVWLHDAPRYGCGILCTYWTEERTRVSTIEEQPQMFAGMPLPGSKPRKVKVTREIVGYAGNKGMNVHPSDFILDPRVPMTEFQAGEFCGRKIRLAWNDLVRGRASGRYFNLDAAKKLGRTTKDTRDDWFGKDIKLPDTEDMSLAGELGDVGSYDAVELWIDLIPKDWQLGSSDYPEKWIFTLINGRVLVEARPFDSYHSRFPFHLLPNEVDGYSIYQRSMLEILEPLNDALTWLLNSHMYNVRAAMNNQFVFDPSRVVTKDLTRKGAGKLIRLKESAYGTDVRSVISQIPVVDMTQGHLRDMQILTDLVNRASGVTDNLMAVLNAGGRKTATEVRQQNTASLTRLKTHAEYWSSLAFGPHAQMLLQNTQQYFDQERAFKITGDLPGGAQFMQVSPVDIQGFYDYVPVDGTLPVDRYAQANLWKEILFGLSKAPELAMQFDLPGIFTWMAQVAGLKNINKFRVQATPDMQVLQQLQAGNIVPMGGLGGQQQARGARAPQRDFERVPEPGQVPGMGATG